jgi:uncharacterized repeat protein (TIGR01451 family)
VTTTVHDPNTENDSAVSTTTIGDANLAATASGPPSVVAGETISYTLSLANAGPDPADSATLSDALPAHTRFVSLTQTAGAPFVLTTPAPDGTGTVTASRALMAPGTSAAFTLVVSLDRDSPATTIVNTATASATTGDPDLADNSATVSTAASAIAIPPSVVPAPALAPAPAPGPALAATPAGRRLRCGRVPDLRRHTLKGARFILARDNCTVRVRHVGHARRPPSHVLRQSVRPGTPLYAGDALIVRLH